MGDEVKVKVKPKMKKLATGSDDGVTKVDLSKSEKEAKENQQPEEVKEEQSKKEEQPRDKKDDKVIGSSRESGREKG